MQSDDITVSCYDNEVPSFVEPELERLYGNIFSSLVQFRIYGWSGANTSTYVASKGGRPVAVFLFQIAHGRARVMNETIRIDSEQVRRFVDYIFAKYPGVNIISFKAVETDIKRLPFPSQRYNCLEDIALALPDSTEKYIASLGKNTRRNIKRYSERLRRNFPSWRFDAYERDQVTPQQIREIIELNRARMAGKNIVSAIDEEETQRIIKLVMACGYVGVITVDGRICAGAISYRRGGNYFLNVLAHHPLYDDYWLGFLCAFHLICACIERGGREFHFLWGRYDYKFTLGAVMRNLDNVAVYRSTMHLLRNARYACGLAGAGFARRARVWMKYDDSAAAKFVRGLVYRIRNRKAPSGEGFAGAKQRALAGQAQEN